MPSTSDAELDPQLLSALGEMVVRHSALEEALRDAIWLEAKTDKVIVHALLSGLSFSTLIEKFGAVDYEHHPAQREAIAALCSHVQAINSERNTYIHSFWATSAGSADMIRLKLSATPRKGLVLRSKGVPASKVHELAITLDAAEDKVWEVISDLTLPLPDTQGAG